MAFRYSGFHPKPPKWQHFVKDSEYQQAMHLYIQMRKTKYSRCFGTTWFLLVEALPQSPENTDLCSGNAARNAAATRFCKSLNLTVKNR